MILRTRRSEDRPVVATRDMARRKRRRRALATLGVGAAVVAGTGYGAWLYIDQQEYLLDERCVLKVGEQEHRLEPEQAANAAQLAALAVDRDLPPAAAAHAVSIALQESDLRAAEAEDDHDGEELFTRGGPEWDSGSDAGPVAVTARDFFDDLVATLPEEDEEDQSNEDGEEDSPSHWNSELTAAETAELLERPHDLSFYEQHEEIGRAFSAPLTGQQPVGMTCHLSQLEVPEPDPAGAADELAATLPSILELPDPEENDVADEDSDPGLDYGEAIEISDEDEGAVVVIDVPERDADEDRSEGATSGSDDVWMIAHWSVAHAERFGIQGVHAGPYVWDRDTTRWERTEKVRDDSVALTFSRDS